MHLFFFYLCSYRCCTIFLSPGRRHPVFSDPIFFPDIPIPIRLASRTLIGRLSPETIKFIIGCINLMRRTSSSVFKRTPIWTAYHDIRKRYVNRIQRSRKPYQNTESRTVRCRTKSRPRKTSATQFKNY